MSTRVVLRSPLGDTVIRSIVDGVWRADIADPDMSLGEGMWALPGLVDGHSHLAGDAMPPDSSPPEQAAARTRARDALEAGVTLLFDKGWSDETVLDLIEAVDATERPHIEAAGRIIASPGGYYSGFAHEIDPADLESTVAREAERRAGWVKLIGDWPRPGIGPQQNFTFDELEAAVRVADQHGRRIAIHTMARDVPSVAVAAGVHSIEHGLFLSEADLDELAARDGIWVPTLRQVEATAASLRPGSSGEALLVEGVANASMLLPLAVEAGVRVLAGTDMAGPSAEVAKEALRIGECGVAPLAVLRIVGLNGHDAAGRSTDFEVGGSADAVLFSADPSVDLGVLGHPSHVIRAGRVVK